MNFPDDLKYTHEHEWIKIENNTALIGITDFAQKELGDIIYVECDRSNNQMLLKDESFGIVEAVKTVSDLFMPISGVITEFNRELIDKPDLLNSMPYSAWIIKIQITNKDEIDTLLDSDSYKKLINQ